MNIQCPQCEAAVPSSAGFCSECGQALPRHTTEIVSPISNAPSPNHLSQWPLDKLLATGAILLLFISFFLPWYTATIVFVGSYSADGFHSWGWLSFAAWLAGLVLAIRLIRPELTSDIPLSKRLDPRALGKLMLVTGCIELIGNVLFVAAAPTGSGDGYSAGIGAGVVIAMIAGVGLVYAALVSLQVPWVSPARWRDRQQSSSPSS
jgi:hypothetical protein